MIEQIPEPRKDSVDLDDWHKILNRTTLQGCGYLCIEVGGINDSTIKPTLKVGSKFEINNSFYRVVDSDYSISATPATNTATDNNYIYAVANGSTVTLKFSKVEPTWNAAKGGWYNGNERAIVKFYYYTNSRGMTLYNNKVILDSYNAKKMHNPTFIIDSGQFIHGVSVFASYNTIIEPTYINIVPGVYLYNIQGGPRNSSSSTEHGVDAILGPHISYGFRFGDVGAVALTGHFISNGEMLVVSSNTRGSEETVPLSKNVYRVGGTIVLSRIG